MGLMVVGAKVGITEGCREGLIVGSIVVGFRVTNAFV